MTGRLLNRYPRPAAQEPPAPERSVRSVPRLNADGLSQARRICFPCYRHSSADLQSAVSQVSNLPRAGGERGSADYKSAIRQIENLRDAKHAPRRQVFRSRIVSFCRQNAGYLFTKHNLEVGTPRCGVPGRVQRAEHFAPPRCPSHVEAPLNAARTAQRATAIELRHFPKFLNLNPTLTLTLTPTPEVHGRIRIRITMTRTVAGVC